MQLELQYPLVFYSLQYGLLVVHGRVDKNKRLQINITIKKKIMTKKITNKISLISERAKKIYKKGSEKWSEAISRATKELKKEGKI